MTGCRLRFSSGPGKGLGAGARHPSLAVACCFRAARMASASFRRYMFRVALMYLAVAGGGLAVALVWQSWTEWRIERTKAFYEAHVPTLEGFREEHGEYPETLSELGLDLPPPLRGSYGRAWDEHAGEPLFDFWFEDPHPLRRRLAPWNSSTTGVTTAGGSSAPKHKCRCLVSWASASLLPDVAGNWVPPSQADESPGTVRHA